MGSRAGHSPTQGMAAGAKRLRGRNLRGRGRGRGRQRAPGNFPIVDDVGGRRRAPGQMTGGWVWALGWTGNGVCWAGVSA